MDNSSGLDWAHVCPALEHVNIRMANALLASGCGKHELTLVAVSKTFPAEAIRAAAACGQQHIGENYVQEARAKQEALKDLALFWHFIGPVQSNKTRELAEHFDWVHGVEREKIARRLSDQRPVALPPLNICLQVNISGEASKSGVPPDQLANLAASVAGLPNLKLRGLMTVPEAGSDPRPGFRLLRTLMETLNAQGYGLDTLSMGMSGDFEAAIAEGATMVRVGSAIFGNRHYPA